MSFAAKYITNTPPHVVTCDHKHRTRETAARCGARTVRRFTSDPNHLPTVAGYSVVIREDI